ncbi:MAG: 50S ribosomal protein L12 [Nanoarchaeota archaeon]
MEEVYAALLLHSLGKQIDEQNVMKILHASGAHTDEAKIKSLVASLKDVDITKELESALAAPTVVASSSSGESKKEEAVKEEKHEAAAEGLSALFG